MNTVGAKKKLSTFVEFRFIIVYLYKDFDRLLIRFSRSLCWVCSVVHDIFLPSIHLCHSLSLVATSCVIGLLVYVFVAQDFCSKDNIVHSIELLIHFKERLLGVPFFFIIKICKFSTSWKKRRSVLIPKFLLILKRKKKSNLNFGVPFIKF